MFLQTELVQAPAVGLQIAQLGVAGVLALGCLALWKAWGLERQGRKDDNEKSSGEIKRLNEERLKDLKEIARLPD